MLIVYGPETAWLASKEIKVSLSLSLGAFRSSSQISVQTKGHLPASPPDEDPSGTDGPLKATTKLRANGREKRSQVYTVKQKAVRSGFVTRGEK